jgi:hypothetical protein
MIDLAGHMKPVASIEGVSCMVVVLGVEGDALGMMRVGVVHDGS